LQGRRRHQDFAQLLLLLLLLVAPSLSSLYSNYLQMPVGKLLVCCWLPFFVVAQAGGLFWGGGTGNFASS